VTVGPRVTLSKFWEYKSTPQDVSDIEIIAAVANTTAKPWMRFVADTNTAVTPSKKLLFAAGDQIR
jgi:hypothetical protein